MADVKFQALDETDLGVLSAQVQDAIVRVGDIAFLPRERRFAMVANRYDWMEANVSKNKSTGQRRAAGLRFETVKRAQVSGFDPRAENAVLVLLTIRFDATDAPAGWITLQFAAGAAIRLEVEYIEAELKDLGAVWATSNRPEHPIAGIEPAARPPRNDGTAE